MVMTIFVTLNAWALYQVFKGWLEGDDHNFDY